jgi:hypothetical protein
MPLNAVQDARAAKRDGQIEAVEFARQIKLAAFAGDDRYLRHVASLAAQAADWIFTEEQREGA